MLLLLLLVHPALAAALTAPENEAAGIPDRPLLKPWYRRREIQERVLFEYGRSTVSFGGAAAKQLLPLLLPLLDGERTVPEIVAAVGLPVEPAVRNALALLARHGLLTQGPRLGADTSVALRRTAVALAQHAAEGPQAILERLRAARIQLEGERELVAAVGRLLCRSGLASALAGGERPALVITAAAVAGDPRLDSRNESALADDCEWLPIGCFDGRTATIGPLVVPRQTACHTCLVLRRDAATSCVPELAALRDVPVVATTSVALTALVAALTAHLVLRWVGLRDPFVPGIVTVVQLSPLEIRSDPVLRAPRCPSCSGLARVALPAPWHEAAA